LELLNVMDRDHPNQRVSGQGIGCQGDEKRIQMVFAKLLDRFLVLRSRLNTKGANEANLREKIKCRVFRLFGAIRVKYFMTLEKP